MDERRAYRARWAADKRRLNPASYQRELAAGRTRSYLKRHGLRITASLHELACAGPPCACPPVWVVR